MRLIYWWYRRCKALGIKPKLTGLQDWIDISKGQYKQTVRWLKTDANRS